MGVICMTMAKAVGCNEILAGGAILSGVFFGDRCSPVSTSALLVAELTHTNIFDNIRLMVKTTILPLILTCVFTVSAGLYFRQRDPEICPWQRAFPACSAWG